MFMASFRSASASFKEKILNAIAATGCEQPHPDRLLGEVADILGRYVLARFGSRGFNPLVPNPIELIVDRYLGADVRRCVAPVLSIPCTGRDSVRGNAIDGGPLLMSRNMYSCELMAWSPGKIAQLHDGRVVACDILTPTIVVLTRPAGDVSCTICLKGVKILSHLNESKNPPVVAASPNRGGGFVVASNIPPMISWYSCDSKCLATLVLGTNARPILCMAIDRNEILNFCNGTSTIFRYALTAKGLVKLDDVSVDMSAYGNIEDGDDYRLLFSSPVSTAAAASRHAVEVTPDADDTTPLLGKSSAVPPGSKKYGGEQANRTCVLSLGVGIDNQLVFVCARSRYRSMTLCRMQNGRVVAVTPLHGLSYGDDPPEMALDLYGNAIVARRGMSRNSPYCGLISVHDLSTGILRVQKQMTWGSRRSSIEPGGMFIARSGHVCISDTGHHSGIPTLCFFNLNIPAAIKEK